MRTAIYDRRTRAVKRFGAAIVAVAAAIHFAACAGDGAKKLPVGPTDPTTPVDTTKNPVDTTKVGGPTEAEKTVALLDTLKRGIDALPHKRGARNPNDVANILRAGKGVTNVLIMSDNSVLAMLPGDIPVTFITSALIDSLPPNYPTGVPDTVPLNEGVRTNDMYGRRRAIANEFEAVNSNVHALAPDIALPSPGKVRFVQTLGPAYIADDLDHVALFRNGNYSDVAALNPEVNILQNMVDVDVLWMQAHSGPAYKHYFTKDKPDVSFAVWTSTEFDVIPFLLYRSLLDNNQVAVMCAVYDFKDGDTFTSAKNRCNFAILPDFIRQQHWKFRPGSMAIFTACSVGASVAEDFRAALLEAGVGSILAWDAAISSRAGQIAANMAADWMLGTNFIAPVSPIKYRPFLWNVVKRTLDSLGVSRFKSPPEFGSSVLSEFKMYSDESKYNNAALNTAISSVSMNPDNNRLNVLGAFGPDPGAANRRVMIGGRSANIVSWSPFLIEATLQNADGGDVFVESTHAGNNKRTTNVRSLTRWTGLISYVRKRYGVLEDALSIRPVFRGDVGTYWSGPRGRLKRNTLTYMGVPGYMMSADSGSTCTSSTGGTYKVDDVYEEVWTQSAPGDIPISKSTSFGCTAQMFVPAGASATGGKLAVYAQSARIKVRTITTTSFDGTKSTTTTNETLIFPMSNIMGGTGVIGPNVQSDGGFNLFAGTRNVNNDPTLTYSFTWSQFPSQFVSGDSRPR